MGLKKFNGKINNQKGKKKFLIISSIFLILITILIYKSYAAYKYNSEKKNVINGVVGNFRSDVDLAIYIYNDSTDKYEQVDEFPAKDSGKKFDKADCSSGTGSWDHGKWSFEISDILESTSCTLYFSEGAPTADYGTNIPEIIRSNCVNIYTTTHGFVGNNYPAEYKYGYGNCGRYSIIPGFQKKINLRNQTPWLSGANYYYFDTYPAANSWVMIRLHGGGATGPNSISGFRLVFDTLQYIDSAVTNDYIEPLVLYGSVNNHDESYGYGFQKLNEDFLTSGTAVGGSYSSLWIYLKVTKKS